MNIDYEDFIAELEREKAAVEELGIAPSSNAKEKNDDTMLEDSDRPKKNKIIHENPEYSGRMKEGSSR